MAWNIWNNTKMGFWLVEDAADDFSDVLDIGKNAKSSQHPVF